MKKKILLLMLAASLTLSACGGASGSTSEAVEAESAGTEAADAEAEVEEDVEATAENPLEEEEYVDEDATPIVDKTIEEEGIDAFISLGEYKGIPLERTVYRVTDEDVENRLLSDLEAYPVTVEDETAILMTGLIANIDYVGDIDGVEFEGGAGEDYDLEIGSGAFIEGFEDQLVEHKKGDVVDVNVTFPEDYYEEVAGKDAHFTVTINAIKEVLAEPTDEWVQTAFAESGYTTVEEYKQNIAAELQTEYEEESDYDLRTEAWDMIADTAVYHQYPQNMIDDFSAIMKGYMEYYADLYGEDLDTFMEENGLTEDYYVSEAKPEVQQSLIAAYILMKENIDLNGTEVDETMQRILAAYGLESIEAAEAAGIPERQLYYMSLRYIAEDKVLELAEITDVEAEETESSEEEYAEEEYGEIVGYAEDGEPIERVEGDAN